MKLTYSKNSQTTFSSEKELAQIITEKENFAVFIAFHPFKCPLFLTVSNCGNRVSTYMRTDSVGNNLTETSFQELISEWEIHVFNQLDYLGK